MITWKTCKNAKNMQHNFWIAFEYVVEYDTNGEWISEGLMSLGGEVIDEPKYIL